MQHLRQLIELILQCDTTTLCFRIGHDSYQRFVIMVHRVDRTLTEVLTTRYICPQRFDLRLDSIHIDITYYDDSLVVRAIPFMVVIAQRLVLEVIDHSRVTDHIAFRILCTRIHLRIQLFPDTTVSCTTGAPFFQDHTALGVYLFV